MPRTPDFTEASALAKPFHTLAAEWKAAVALLSSATAMCNHPAYRAIIALGHLVVPLLLRELEREPVHWFEALAAITGEDPVASADWGKVVAASRAWLAWGRKRGLV